MIGDYDDDTHFCLKCHATILGLDNYVAHRKAGCTKNLEEPLKSPLPSQILQQDESFSSLKADDFFSSLELQSSAKKAAQSTTGKNFSGILTRSKTTAVLQATSSKEEFQHSKSGKNAWIGGHQFKDLGSGDNQSKLIKAVDNLSRNTLKREEPPNIRVYEESDEDSEEYGFDEESDEEENQEAPPRSFTGGKWKPSSPIGWARPTSSNDTGWRSPPPSHTKGKWKPVSPISSSSKDDYVPPPSSFTGSKWTQSKASACGRDYAPPPTHTKGKWKPNFAPESETEVNDYPPPEHTKGKWKPGNMPEDQKDYEAKCNKAKPRASHEGKYSDLPFI